MTRATQQLVILTSSVGASPRVRRDALGLRAPGSVTELELTRPGSEAQSVPRATDHLVAEPALGALAEATELRVQLRPIVLSPARAWCELAEDDASTDVVQVDPDERQRHVEREAFGRANDLGEVRWDRDRGVVDVPWTGATVVGPVREDHAKPLLRGMDGHRSQQDQPNLAVERVDLDVDRKRVVVDPRQELFGEERAPDPTLVLTCAQPFDDLGRGERVFARHDPPVISIPSRREDPLGTGTAVALQHHRCG